jgi:hypothetical protein
MLHEVTLRRKRISTNMIQTQYQHKVRERTHRVNVYGCGIADYETDLVIASRKMAFIRA